MSETITKIGMGWLRDYPDIRDFNETHNVVSNKLLALNQTDPIKAMVKKAGLTDVTKVPLKLAIDLRPWCSPIENQLSIGSCTAHAGVGLVEYFEKRAFGNYIDASRLFLYKVTRDMLHWTGDTGAFLRSTIGAMAVFGVPPEEYWPYIIANYDIEPSAFCFSFAQNFQALSYLRLDPSGTLKPLLLTKIKAYIQAGIPSMFGFTVYSSIAQAAVSGKTPFPAPGERVLGGHAIDAIGFDDSMKIKNTNPGGVETTGALLIRNSWGPGWGAAGYGWLPYDYVLKGLAVDWWVLLKNEWINTGIFKI